MPTTPVTDNAFLGPLKGGSMEPAYAGALSFMRRRYSRALAGVDAVVWGVPFDQATTNRPGARFGPQAIRRASALDFGRPMEAAEAIERQALDIVRSGAQLLSLGGDHFITYPLLRAHAD